jgi:short-subunit dehydrogenase
MRHIVIVGATSAIATHCARLWAAQACVFTLVGRDREKLDRLAADIKVRNPQSTLHIETLDFSDVGAIQQSVAAIAVRATVDIALIAHGALPDQSACQDDLYQCSEALHINGISPVLFAEAFAQSMTRKNHGTLALIGSVAGDRGRKSNYVYGAAKGLVTRYAQGLQHRFAASNVKIVLIKPGPTDTPMTAHMKDAGMKFAPVEMVAAQCVAAIEQGRPVAYVPGKWWLIMQVIRHLPAFVFNKMNI